jgi:hypothetical protein
VLERNMQFYVEMWVAHPSKRDTQGQKAAKLIHTVNVICDRFLIVGQ